jgi:hypothetical protein
MIREAFRDLILQQYEVVVVKCRVCQKDILAIMKGEIIKEPQYEKIKRRRNYWILGECCGKEIRLDDRKIEKQWQWQLLTPKDRRYFIKAGCPPEYVYHLESHIAWLIEYEGNRSRAENTRQGLKEFLKKLNNSALKLQKNLDELEDCYKILDGVFDISYSEFLKKGKWEEYKSDLRDRLETLQWMVNNHSVGNLPKSKRLKTEVMDLIKKDDAKELGFNHTIVLAYVEALIDRLCRHGISRKN